MREIKTSEGLLDIFGEDTIMIRPKDSSENKEKENEEILENTRDSKKTANLEGTQRKANRNDKKFIEKKKTKMIRIIESNPETIVMIRPPSRLFFNTQEINYKIRRLSSSLLLRKTNIDLLLTGLRSVQERLEKIASETWYELSTVYPYASVYNIKSWRLLNEKPNEKKALIENNTINCYILTPYSEEVGMIATVIKHMCLLRTKLRYYPDENLAITLRKIKDRLTEETDDILKTIEKLNENINS